MGKTYDKNFVDFSKTLYLPAHVFPDGNMDKTRVRENYYLVREITG
jgi:hypothetical protein